MFKAIKESSPSGRWVYYQYLLYLILMIASTFYAYYRLEIVRSEEKREEQALERLIEQ